MFPLFSKLPLGRDSLWHAILQGNSVTEHDRGTTSRNKDVLYSVARHGASDMKVLGLGKYFIKVVQVFREREVCNRVYRSK